MNRIHVLCRLAVAPFPDSLQSGGVGAQERTSELRNNWTPMTSGVDLILGLFENGRSAEWLLALGLGLPRTILPKMLPTLSLLALSYASMSLFHYLSEVANNASITKTMITLPYANLSIVLDAYTLGSPARSRTSRKW